MNPRMMSLSRSSNHLSPQMIRFSLWACSSRPGEESDSFEDSSLTRGKSNIIQEKKI